MSLEIDRLMVAPILLGHVGLWAVITNVSHALGLSDRWIAVIKLILLTAILAIPLWILGWALRAPYASWPWLLRGYAAVCLATACIGLPLTTLLFKYRRVPEGISGRSTEIDLAETEGKESLIGPGKYSWLLRLPGNESLRLKTTEWEVVLPNLPTEWDGLSVVHLTDIHLAPCYRRRFFEAVADIAAGWDADLLLFTGDLVDHDDAIHWVEPVMARLRARYGNFAILGNHDVEHQPERIRQALEDAGFADLDGRWTRLEIDGATLAIGGTSYPWGPRLAHEEMPEADFRLLLSHTPDRFPWAARRGIDLVLSGHNHAGQVRLPLVGPVLMPSIYSRRFDRDFFRLGRSLLYVSPGISGKHPLRYGGCVPELTRLVLRVPHSRERRLSGYRYGQADQEELAQT
jgi:predicted MPP superfamily phosphohydrolase